MICVVGFSPQALKGAIFKSFKRGSEEPLFHKST